jgi:cobalamin biosynthesis Mg chelatase CobN
MKPMFLVALCATIGAFAQAPVALSGTIDGAPLPPKLANVQNEAVTSSMVPHQRQPTSSAADQQEITATEQTLFCRYLKAAISQAGINRAKAELHISATAREIAAAKRQMNLHAPDFHKLWAQGQERTKTLVAGLTAVYGQAQGPQQVYAQMIAPHHIGQQEWLWEVYTHRTKADRDKLAKMLTWTPDTYAQGLNDPSRIKYFAEGLKIAAAVDQRIAAIDPSFKTYLIEYNTKAKHPDPNDPSSVSVALSQGQLQHLHYLDHARAAWWKAENTKVQVNLSNTVLSLSSQCTGLTDPPPSPYDHLYPGLQPSAPPASGIATFRPQSLRLR